MNTLYFSPLLTQLSTYFVIVSFIFFGGSTLYGIGHYRFFLWRFIVLIFGVLFFEFLTSSLWITAHLGSYSYLNGDVSIVLTLFWASLIFSMRFLYDRYSTRKSLFREFVTIILSSTILGLTTITLLKEIGVFSYAPEMQGIIDNGMSFFGRPLEAILYFPIFIFVAYSFYKYWELAMYNKLFFLDYSLLPRRDMIIAIIIIVAIGYLMHPLFITHTLYAYPSLVVGALFSLFFVNIAISLATHFPFSIRYLLGTIIFSLFFGSILSYLIEINWIQIGESLKINYTQRTILVPGFHFTDSEAVGILFFSYLLIAIAKYYKIVFSHDSVEVEDDRMTFRGWKSLIH